MTEKRILLYWGYNRKAWMKPFELIKDRFHFELLFFVDPKDENLSFSDLPKHYWKNFRNAQEIVEKIRPEKVVFMSIDAPSTMALNAVCRKRKIPTYVFQHGLFHSFAKYMRLQEEQDKRREETGLKQSESVTPGLYKFLRSFFLRSIGFMDIPLFWSLWKLTRAKKQHNVYRALQLAQSESRLADQYIVYTKYNAEVYQECDGVPEDRMLEIGNPEMDEFHQFLPQMKQENYFLLVDQSFAEIKEFNSPGYGPKKEELKNFYRRLADYCANQGAILKVKLHPYSYTSDFFEDGPNLEFIRDTDLVPLLMNSRSVFGFFSSLMVPAVYYKPSVIFRMFEESDFINDVEACGLAKVVSFQNFEVKDIEFPNSKPEKGLREFEEKYLYRQDGRAVERLAAILDS
jgi:hypothetical protein